MLIVITALIPKRRRKNGMVRMNSVSEICEIDMMIAGYFTAIASWNAGTLAKSCRKVSPYALVSCSAAPSSIANTKNTAMLRSLNRRNEVSPSTRSEEHTSELQSLMRISYAVFCLKKKNHKRIQQVKERRDVI